MWIFYALKFYGRGCEEYNTFGKSLRRFVSTVLSPRPPVYSKETNMNAQLSQFCDQKIAIIDHNHQKWLTAEQLGLALGFSEKHAKDGINRLYRRHADEFSDADSTTVKLTALDNKNRLTRIFSLSGCNLISFFANTPRAKRFRRWAAEVLAKESPKETPSESLHQLNAYMAQLAQGMNMVLTQNQMVHKYIALLEMNQKGKRRVVPEDAQLVRQLREEGMGWADIARTIRLSASTVKRLYDGNYPFSSQPLPMTIEQALNNMVKREEEKVRALLGLGEENV